MHKYLVIVGNIGTVYNGYDQNEARAEYDWYVTMSERSTGRAANEPVTMLHGDDIVAEHTPELIEEVA